MQSHPTFSNPPSIQSPISLDPYLFRPTISTTSYFFRPIFSSTPYLFKSTISNPPSVQPFTSLDPPSVQSLTFLDLSPLQPSTFSNPLLVSTIPYVDPLSLHLDAFLATPLGLEFRTSILLSPKSFIFVLIPMQTDTSTQLYLPPTILRGRSGLRRPRLLPPPPHLFPTLTLSQIDVLHV